MMVMTMIMIIIENQLLKIDYVPDPLYTVPPLTLLTTLQCRFYNTVKDPKV